jgi:hypothetical protein
MKISRESKSEGAAALFGAFIVNLNPKTHTFRHLMKTRIPSLLFQAAVALLFTVLAAGPLAQAQTLVLQLKAANYNPATGLWTASVGANAQATGTFPTLSNGVSPNGSPAVVFSGSNPMQLATAIPITSGYTVFAYIEPASGAGPYALLGGAAGSFEYRIYNSKQDALRQSQADLGSETTALATTAFSLIDATVSGSGGAFRLNETNDGSTSGTTFTSTINAIGSRASGGGENFSGSICEIDIYNGVLNSAQISTVEAALTASYITTGPAVLVGLATVSPTNDVYAGTSVTLAAPVTGATNTTVFQWQTDNGSGGATFANITGATSTNYVLNTSALLGTYEYQLVVTPQGGNAVTSAPVTLTVEAASAPTVSVDTTGFPATAAVGGNETFSASFVGTLPINYQWQVSTNASGAGAVNLSGATNTSLVLTNLQLTNSGKYYSLRATNTVAPYVANSSWVPLTVLPLAPLVQLVATNYNPGTATWTDSTTNGNNALYSGGSIPTLASFVTPNGASAVNIAAGTFLLSSALDPSSGYTVIAYLEPFNTSGRHALTGGSSPTALEYDIYNGTQDYLTEYTSDVGHGLATVPTNSFSLVDLAVDSTGGTFRINGVVDATVPGATFGTPITRVGNNEGGGDGFVGQIAEIDIYSAALTYGQITNVEAQLMAKYATVNTVIVGTATVSPTNNTYAGNPITLSAPLIGATGTTTYKWQTDNGSGGVNFANINGATGSNYVLNTTSLLGTYEYRLIVTPFGGSSVTSAPVTLTVQSPSAPVITSDTSFNPMVGMVAGSDTLTASFVGNLPIAYQWLVSTNANGSGAVLIAGATNSSLVLTNLQLTNSGNYYSLRATNAISPYVASSTWVQFTVLEFTPAVQLIATNYDTNSGTWTDSSLNGNNATYTGAALPTLDAAVTTNGSPAVDITNGSFILTTPLGAGIGYTVFAYVQPFDTAARHALTGGSSPGALEYDIYNGAQDYLREYQADVGHGNATVPTNVFSMVGLAVNSSGAVFRIDGASDGSVSGAAFGSSITRVGNNEGGGDGFTGRIAEIDIYTGVLNATQISNVEAQLSSIYGAVRYISGNPTNITATVTGGQLQLSWPADHIGWTLEAQTNTLKTGLGTNWVVVPNSTTTNQVTIPIVRTNPSVFYRLQR